MVWLEEKSNHMLPYFSEIQGIGRGKRRNVLVAEKSERLAISTDKGHENCDYFSFEVWTNENACIMNLWQFHIKKHSDVSADKCRKFACSGDSAMGEARHLGLEVENRTVPPTWGACHPARLLDPPLCVCKQISTSLEGSAHHGLPSSRCAVPPTLISAMSGRGHSLSDWSHTSIHELHFSPHFVTNFVTCSAQQWSVSAEISCLMQRHWAVQRKVQACMLQATLVPQPNTMGRRPQAHHVWLGLLPFGSDFTSPWVEPLVP